VIYCGVDAEELAAPKRPASAPHLLYVGRLVSVKGVDRASAAFAAIKRDFPGATLTIAGDGPERAALEAQVLEAGLGASVTFTGWIEPAGIPTLMASATLVLVPSRWREAFGLVSLEAALQARPVVGAAVGGIREIVEHGVTGVLVPKDDAGALAQAAISLLSDPYGLAAMGRRARQRAEQVFGVEANLEAFDRLYRRLAAA
jgi:glycogen(starch) synthase